MNEPLQGSQWLSLESIIVLSSEAALRACGGGGAPRDSAGSGATEEGLTSRSFICHLPPLPLNLKRATFGLCPTALHRMDPHTCAEENNIRAGVHICTECT